MFTASVAGGDNNCPANLDRPNSHRNCSNRDKCIKNKNFMVISNNQRVNKIYPNGNIKIYQQQLPFWSW